MNSGTMLPSKKICFALLVHNKRKVVQDLLDNIRLYCPNSAVVLYNGGSDPDLCADMGYPVCPTSRKLTYGVTAIYLVEIMEWLERIHFDYDYLINLDSDALFLREGYETFIEQAMKDSDYMGVDVFIREKNWICGLHLKKEWELWKPLLLTDKFLGAFNVGQVLSKRLVKTLLAWEQFGKLKQNLLHTKAYGVDEIVYVMIAERLGFKPKSYPKETGSAVRYRPYYKYQEIVHLMNKHIRSYLLHPIKRDMVDEARTLLRDLMRRNWRRNLVPSNSLFSESFQGMQEIRGKLGIVRTGDNLEVVAPLREGGLGYWRYGKDKKSPHWDGPVKFGKGKWDAVSIIRSGYGNLEIIGIKEQRLNHIWRDHKRTMGWIKNPSLTSSVSGTPFFMESRNGDFHVAAPLTNGGIGHWWRNNNHQRMAWHGPEIVATGNMHVVSLMNTHNNRLVLVVENDGRLQTYIRNNKRWKFGERG